MKKTLCYLLLFCFTLPLFAKNTILIMGDSLSANYGFDTQLGWVNLLQQHLQQHHYDYKVVNLSVSGATTSNGLSRLPSALKDYQPAITIIQLGGNDGLRGLQIATIKQNLNQMIELAQTQGSKVLLIGLRIPPNYGPQYTTEFQQVYKDLSGEHGVALVPLFLEQIDDNPQLMQADRIHPTAKAQVILFNNVWPTLEKLINN